MAGRAFKVPVPVNYNNVTEAKLVQNGGKVWVQLPANMVADRRVGTSVYMQDYNKNSRLIPHRYRNAKAKVVTRRSNNPHASEDFLGFRGDPTRYRGKHCMDLGSGLDVTPCKSERKRMYRSSSSSFDGMPSESNYSRMKSKRSGPIAALLPVMYGTGNPKSPELQMNQHYASPRIMSSDRSYNDKAREGLPGLGKWLDSGDIHDTTVRKHSTTIDGGNFLENPLMRADLINHDDVKRTVSILTPPRVHSSRQSSRSAGLGRRLHEGPAILDHSDLPVTHGSHTFENSAKRHELEILTRVNPHTQALDSSALGHLYQPLGYTNRPGYTVVGQSYEHGNATFSHTGPTRGSFNIAPDWVSENKKSVVIRN